jgi:hypothetical protein
MPHTVPDNDNQHFHDADDKDDNSSTDTEGLIKLKITNIGKKKKRKSRYGITIPASQVTNNDVLMGNAYRTVHHPGNINWKNSWNNNRPTNSIQRVNKRRLSIGSIVSWDAS